MTSYIYYLPNSEKVIEQPNKIKLPLMEHQKYALNHCINLETKTNIKVEGTDYFVSTNKALYCDPVGAGKSLVMLSLIAEYPMVKRKVELGYKCTNDILITKKINECEVTPISLIVVPNTLYSQWSKYILNQTKLNFTFIATKKDIELYRNDNKSYDGILLNATYYNDFADVLSNRYISRLIIDEVHMVKIPASKKINASFYWFISASPNEIKMSSFTQRYFLKRCLADIIWMDIVSGLIFRNHQQIIDLSIKLVPYKLLLLKVKSNNILKVLDGCVKSSVLEAISAGDIKSAVGQLSLEDVNEDNIISVVNNKLLKQLQTLKDKYEFKQSQTYSSLKAKEDSLASTQSKIQSIKDKINSIKNRIMDNNIDPISYEEITTPVITKCCQQKFDFSTITKYLLQVKQSCPMCRTVLNATDLLMFNNKDEKIKDNKNNDISTYKSKYDALTDLFNKLPLQAKILVSSGPTGNFDEIKLVCDHSNRTIRKFNGNLNVKNKILSNFHDCACNVLYLPAYESGSGLNLTDVTDLILYHKMPVEIENQIIGRAHRLGRTEVLNVWKIYYDNE